MKRLHASIAVASCAIAFSAGAPAAQRTFVASTGLDANPCSVTQPCRSFAAAILLTSANGEIVVLDSAGYGPVTISQAVSIVAPPGVYAGISVPGGQNGITVSAGPNDHVVLSGLTINGQGGSHGIRIISGQEIHVESCTASNMTLDGIRIEGGTTVHVASSVMRSNGSTGLHTLPGTTTLVHARDSRFVRNNTGVHVESGNFDGAGLTIEESPNVGMFVAPGPATSVKANLADSLLDGNSYGYVAYASGAGMTVRAAAVRVTASRNAFAGFEANGGGTGVSTLTVSQSASVGNGTYGITAISGATTVVTGTTSSGNTGADLLQSTSGILRTSINNTLSGRGPADVSGALTTNSLQ